MAFISRVPRDNNEDVVDRSLIVREEAISLLKFHLQRAQVRMKNMANKKRINWEFELNDWVYVKLRLYRKNSMRKNKHHKLSPKFYGPYQVIARVGQVSYRLNLPINSQIHPVFHVSRLKAYKGDNLNTQKALPEVDDDVVISNKPQVVFRKEHIQERRIGS
ncbi:hypothetical protein Tco_0966600 [Tanacetum coccineum]